MLIRLKTTVLRNAFSDAMHRTLPISSKMRLHTDDDERKQLIAMLHNAIGDNGVDLATRVANSKRQSVRLKRLLPKLVHVQEQAVGPMQLYDGSAAFQPERSVRVRLLLDDTGQSLTWTMGELCASEAEVFKCDNDGGARLFVFSDPIEQPALLGRMGIIGLYTTVCLVLARKLRGLVFGGLYLIMYANLPQVDALLQLCYDLYLVRASGEFELEEDLFAKLLYLHRSPETLVEFTRLVEPPPVLESWVIQAVETTDDQRIRRMRDQLDEL